MEPKSCTSSIQHILGPKEKKMAIKMTAAQLTTLVLNLPYNESTIFSVTFIKRTTGELRKMVCRRGVKRHLAGGELKYKPKNLGLLSVYDMEKQAYRSTSCEAIQEVHLKGQHYIPKGK